jgi:hypothetical protein
MRSRRVTCLFPALLCGVVHASCGQSPSQLGVGVFLWNVTPERLTLQPGSSGSFAIRLDSKVNINSNVTLAFSGTLPENSTPTLNPTSLGSTGRDATLTLQTTAQTPEGAYTLRFTATEAGVSTYAIDRLVEIVTGTGPDFTLEAEPAETTLTRAGSSSQTMTFYVRPRNGFSGTVDVTLEGVATPPAPVAVVIPVTPAQLVITGTGGAGGTYVLGLPERPSYPPSVTLSLRAASGSIVHTRQIKVNITLGGQ